MEVIANCSGQPSVDNLWNPYWKQVPAKKVLLINERNRHYSFILDIYICRLYNEKDTFQSFGQDG